jgi:hypothetical protein
MNSEQGLIPGTGSFGLCPYQVSEPVLFGSGFPVGLAVVFSLIAAPAASQMRAPLTESAIRTIVFLIASLFQTADEPISRYFKTHTPFIDKLLFSVSHLFQPSSASS